MASSLTDAQISAAASLKPIDVVGKDAGVPAEELIPHGRHMAKVDVRALGGMTHRRQWLGGSRWRRCVSRPWVGCSGRRAGRRAVDATDRSLRHTVIGLGGKAQGVPR